MTQMSIVLHCMSLGAKHNLSMQMRLIVPTILLKVADSAAAAFHDNDGVVVWNMKCVSNNSNDMERGW